MKPVTFGIIEAGRLGKLHGDNLLNRVEGVRLKAITDSFLDEAWAQSRNILVTGKDHRVMLDDPEIGGDGDVDTAVISLKFANGALGIIENSRKAVYGYD